MKTKKITEFGFKCPMCGKGRMTEKTYPKHKIVWRGMSVTIQNAILAKCNKCKETSVAALEVKRWQEIAERQCCNKIKCRKDRKAIVDRLLLDNQIEKRKLRALLKKTEKKSQIHYEKIRNREEVLLSLCGDLFAELWHILGKTELWHYLRTRAVWDDTEKIFRLGVFYDDELGYKLRHHLIELTEKIAPEFFKMTGIQIYIIGTGIICPEIKKKDPKNV